MNGSCFKVKGKGPLYGINVDIDSASRFYKHIAKTEMAINKLEKFGNLHGTILVALVQYRYTNEFCTERPTDSKH